MLMVDLTRSNRSREPLPWRIEIAPSGTIGTGDFALQAKSGDRMSKELNALNKRQSGNSARAVCGISRLSQNLGEASSCITA